jgi:hypothetical protein
VQVRQGIIYNEDDLGIHRDDSTGGATGVK